MFLPHGLGGLEVPGHEIVDLTLFVSVRERGECLGQVGMWLDGVELCRFDQRRNDPPICTAFVVTCEEGILAVQGQFPFILPMSGKYLGSIIDGMPTLGRMSGYF